MFTLNSLRSRWRDFDTNVMKRLFGGANHDRSTRGYVMMQADGSNGNGHMNGNESKSPAHINGGGGATLLASLSPAHDNQLRVQDDENSDDDGSTEVGMRHDVSRVGLGTSQSLKMSSHPSGQIRLSSRARSDSDDND
jgi:hypothetical protein